jgi:hypothetical protein
MVTHKLAKTDEPYQDPGVEQPWLEPVMKSIQEYTTYSKSKRKVIQQLLSNLPRVLGRSMTPHNVKKGWKDSGLGPNDAHKIMMNNPVYAEMTGADRMEVLMAVRALKDVAYAKGMIEENEFEKYDILQSDTVGIDEEEKGMMATLAAEATKKHKKAQPLANRMNTHQRTLWLGHEWILGRRQRILDNRQREKEEEKAEKERLKTKEKDKKQKEKDKKQKEQNDKKASKREFKIVEERKNYCAICTTKYTKKYDKPPNVWSGCEHCTVFWLCSNCMATSNQAMIIHENNCRESQSRKKSKKK